MIEIIEKEDEYRRNLPEDVFFAQSTKTHLNRPEPYEASKFSIENWFGCGVSFGRHKPWTYFHDYCNKHTESWLDFDLGLFKYDFFILSTFGSKKNQQLLCDDRQYLNVNSIELVETTPSTSSS